MNLPDAKLNQPRRTPPHRGLFAIPWIACIALIACIVASLARPTRAADALLAHGSEKTLWIAQVGVDKTVKTPNDRTVIRYRSLGGDTNWRELPALAGRATALASRGSTVAVLMENGEWLSVWPTGSSTGAPLPDGAKMIDLAGEGNELFALGVTSVTPIPATGPSATGPSASGTSTTGGPTSSAVVTSTKSLMTTTTAPMRDHLCLYSFSDSGWTLRAEVPGNLNPADAQASLAIVDSAPAVAVAINDRAIEVWQHSLDRGWTDRGVVSNLPSYQDFKLVGMNQRPMLWLATGGVVGTLYVGGERWGDPVELALSKSIDPAIARALEPAGGNLRFFALTGAAKVYEQCFKADGARNGDVTLLPTARRVQMVDSTWQNLVMMAALVLLMVGSFRTRGAEAMVKLQSGPVQLAPASLRILAGLVDLLPLAVAALWLHFVQDTSADGVSEETILIAFCAALPIYLLHTTIGEALTGRTLGKWLTKLRVVGIDGAKARLGPIILRNLLRVIDIPLAVLILFTPLQQRLGDLAAGTIVISTAPPKPRAADDDLA